MRLRYFIVLLLTSGLSSLAATFFIISRIAPGTSILLPLLFTLCIFLAITSLMSALLIVKRSLGSHTWRAQKNLSISLRQGSLIGLYVIIGVWLARFNLFHWWSLLILSLAFGFFEYNLLPEEVHQSPE